MKKRVTVILEVENDDDINISDEFIQFDLKQEISCASNHYDVINIQTEVLDNEFIYGLTKEKETNCSEQDVHMPCKRCGYEKYRMIHYKNGHRCSCVECGYCTKLKATPELAVEAWNQR